MTGNVFNGQYQSCLKPEPKNKENQFNQGNSSVCYISTTDQRPTFHHSFYIVYICLHQENECNSCFLHFTNDFTSSPDTFTYNSAWNCISDKPGLHIPIYMRIILTNDYRKISFVFRESLDIYEVCLCHYANLSPKVPLGIRQKRQDAITVLPHKHGLIKNLFIPISKCISAFFLTNMISMFIALVDRNSKESKKLTGCFSCLLFLL